MWWLATILACGAGADPAQDTGATPDLGTCDALGPSVVGILNQLTFARASEEGISHGFDLDGVVTNAGGSTGCGVGDYTSPEGASGVDNAFSPLLAILETTEAQAVEPLIQDTINAGQLLIFFELEGVDDPVDDPCVSLKLLRGTGTPVVGNDRIVSGQTFERDEETFSSRVDGVSIEGGTVLAGPLTLDLPITVFNLDLQFTLREARIRLDLREDGSAWGIMAGGIVVDEVLSVALEQNVDPEVSAILSSVLGLMADLGPDADGTCQQISVTLEFQAVNAFFFED